MKALFKCGSIEFHTHTKQAQEFVHKLDGVDWSRLTAQCHLLADALETGTPPTGRTAKVRGSKQLWELKVTPPGSSGPQARLLYVVDGKKVLFLRGVDKRQPRLSRHDIGLAERDAAAYAETKDGERP